MTKQNAEKLEPSYIASRNIKWCKCCGKQLVVPQKLNTELAYNLSFLFLGTQPREMKTHVHTKTCK